MTLKQFITGGLATILAVAGCFLFFPGEDAKHQAGVVLLIAACAVLTIGGKNAQN